MIHAFALSLLLQGDPVHAELHPRETDVYMEIGDFGQLCTALEGAPVMQLLHDERVKGLLSELGPEIDLSPRALMREGLTQLLPGTESGAWLDGLKALSVSFVFTKGSEEGFEAVVDFAEAPQASAFLSALESKASKHEPLPGGVPGVERLVMGDAPDDELWCLTAGPRLVIGSGTTKPEQVAGRIDKKTAGFSGNESFQQGRKALGPAKGTTLGWFAMSRSLVDLLKDSGVDEETTKVLDEVPSDLNPLGGPRTARMQWVGGRFVTEIFGAEKEGDSAASSRPVQATWLEPVPSSAMLFFSTAFDGAGAGKQLSELLKQDEARATAVSAIEGRLGFGPERALTRLGPGLTVYSGPLVIGPPVLGAWIDCEDPAAFTADLEAWIGALGETLPGFSLKTRPYKLKDAATGEKVEVPVTTINLPKSIELPPMFYAAPSFAPVGKKLVWALNSQNVKDELKRVYVGEEEPIKSGANPLAARGFALPEGASSVVVMDWAKLFVSLLNMAKGFGGMSPESMPFDLAKLPPPEIFTAYLKPTFHFVKPVPGGRYRRNEASFGPETWFGLLGLASKAQSQMQMQPEAMDGLAPVPLEPPSEPKSNGDSGGN